MKFTLEIDLGNDHMCTGGNVAYALREVSGRLASRLVGVITEPEAPHNIRDANGNTVGFWTITEEEGDR